MLTFKNINPYLPEYIDVMPFCVYLQSEEGEDWYYSRLKFHEKTLKVCYGPDNIIRMAHYNAEYLCPPAGSSVSEVAPEDIPEGFDDMGNWAYIDGKVVPKPVDHVSVATERLAELFSEARQAMGDLQCEALAGLITEEDRIQLKKWVLYLKQLKELDISMAPDLIWPEKP